MYALWNWCGWCTTGVFACHRKVVKLDQDFGSSFSGVLASGEGRLRALWASFSEQVRLADSRRHHTERCNALHGPRLPVSAGSMLAQELGCGGACAAKGASMHSQCKAQKTKSSISHGAQVGTEDREWCAGLQTSVFAPWVQRLVAGRMPPAQQQQQQEPVLAAMDVSLLDVELEPVLLSRAAHLGLPAAWVARMAKLDNRRRQVCDPAAGPPTLGWLVHEANLKISNIHPQDLQQGLSQGWPA